MARALRTMMPDLCMAGTAKFGRFHFDLWHEPFCITVTPTDTGSWLLSMDTDVYAIIFQKAFLVWFIPDHGFHHDEEKWVKNKSCFHLAGFFEPYFMGPCI